MGLTPEQLEWRRGGIGGSEAAAILGIDPYRTAYQVWAEKTGKLEEEDLEGNESVHFGNLLENYAAEEFTLRTEKKVQRDNRNLEHPEFPFIRGHIDRRVVGENAVLEIKNRVHWMARHYGPSGSTELYDCDYVQVQHYLGVLGWSSGYVGVYFGGPDFRIYEVPRNDVFIDTLISIEEDFWLTHVLGGVPPDLDFDHRSTEALITKLYPGTNGESITLPGEAVHWHEVLQQAREKRLAYEKVEAGARAHLLEMMGEAAVGLLPDGTGYTRKYVDRKEYTIAATSYLDFRHSKAPKAPKKAKEKAA